MIGPYKIREQIGEGGMGTVYVAEQQKPVRRKVALKIIRTAIASKETVARFEAERQALAMMEHPNIAKVLDGGTTSTGQPFFAMELVQGVPITKYADDHHLSTSQRLELFVVVCRAVQHAHRKGVIHRDLKPSNILVSEIDGRWVPKIIDFGLAKAVDEPLTDGSVYTRFTQMIGTPSYMSPEQAAMGVIDVDTRSDVYSLGVLLYELLVGEPPFSRKTFLEASFDEVRRLIREVEPPRPSTAISSLQGERRSTIAASRGIDQRKLRESVRGELDWLVMKALEKDRDRRYGSAAEMAADIERFLDNEPVHACPPSFVYRFRKSVYRNRIAISVIGLILAALVTTSIVSTWQVVQVRRAWLASQARERRSNDLLEGMRLQSSVSAMRQKDFAQLSRAVRPMLNNRSLADSDQRADAGSLVDLLQVTANPQPIRTFAIPSRVHDLATDAEGKCMASIDERGNLTCWDIASEESGYTSTLGHGEPAHAVAVSPDGNRVVSGSTNGHVFFWDRESGQCDRQLQPLSTGIETIIWSPDGQRVAIGARYSEVWVSDVDGNELFRIENDQRHESLLFTPDGKQLVVPTRQGIDVWDVGSGKRLRSLATEPLSNVRALCWAGPEKQWLVAGERFSEVLIVLDWESGKLVGAMPVAAEYAKSLACSPDGYWLAGGYANGLVQLFSLAEGTGGQVRGSLRFQYTAHRKQSTFSNETRTTVQWVNANQFLSGGSDGEIHLWDRNQIRSTRELRPPDAVHTAYLLNEHELAFLYYGPTEKDARLFRFSSHEASNQRMGAPIPFNIQSLTKRLSRNLMAIGGAEEVVVYSVAKGEMISRIPSPLSEIHHIALSRDGTELAAVSNTHVCVWETSDNWKSHRLLRTWEMVVAAEPVFADAGKTLIVDDESAQTVVELDVESGEVRATYELSLDWAVCLSHDDRLLAIGSQYEIIVVDRQTGDVHFRVEHLSQPRALAFFPDDRVLVSGHLSHNVLAWHIPTGQALGRLYRPTDFPGLLESIQVADDGRRLMISYRHNAELQPTILGCSPRRIERTLADVR